MKLKSLILLCCGLTLLPWSLQAADTISITVLGAVAYPGKVQLRPDATILDALVAVGGIGNAGRFDKISVKRLEQGVPATHTINAAIELKRYQAAFKLKNDDVLNVPAIFENFPPPRFFNEVLWGWGIFRLQTLEPSDHLKSLLAAMDDRGSDSRLIPPTGKPAKVGK